MKKIPEEQIEKVCKKLHLEKCIELCERDNNPISIYSREMGTGKYNEEWKRKKLLEIIKNNYEPLYDIIKKLRSSNSEENYKLKCQEE